MERFLSIFETVTISLLSSMVGAWFGAWYGSKLSRKATFEAIEYQMKSESKNRNNAYLRNLTEELEHNKKILHHLKSYIGPGPNIEHLWEPADIIASSLRTEAWNALIKSGTLPIFSEEEQRSLSITNRTVIDTRRIVKEMSANWHRIREWERHDLEKSNPQPASLKNFQQRAEDECRGRVDYSIERLDEAIELLKTITKES